MISSLLKNRRLRLQLLVGLLLVLGTFPEPSKGLKCYLCNDFDNGDEEPLESPQGTIVPRCTQQQLEEDSPPGYGYCSNLVTDSPRGQLMLKYSHQSADGECMKKEFKSSCKGSTDIPGADRLEATIKRCYHVAKKSRQGKGRYQSTQPALTMCLCNTDFCNDDRFCGRGGCDYIPETTESGQLSSILHPFNSITTAILTLAFYNYT